MRGRAISRFLEQLADGDPIALGFVGFFVVVGLAVGLYVLKVRRDLRREDEERSRRYGRGPRPK
ncbi:MAG: hypothetical protein JWO38_3464 [Gemmataceae bacterium]|nr:hypothetical protein [Gemmataceae bacterium]